MCQCSEGHLYEPLACETGSTRNVERATLLRAKFAGSYNKNVGAFKVPGHDCDYVKRRNSRISAAERLADRAVADVFPPGDRENPLARSMWSRHFLVAMTELAEKRSTQVPQAA